MFLAPEDIARLKGPKLPRGKFASLVASASKRRQPNWAAMGCSAEEQAALHTKGYVDAAQSVARSATIARARLARKFARVLPMDRLRALPTETADAEIVYFLWRGPRLLYVGQTVQAEIRFEQHWVAGKRWSRATVLAVPSGLGRTIEADYVRRYRPPLNRTTSG